MLDGNNLRLSYLVADDHGVLGYVRFLSVEEGSYLWSFAKNPQRNSVGKLLLEAGVECARKLGATRILAKVEEQNVKSVFLHEQMGFVLFPGSISRIKSDPGQLLFLLRLDFEKNE